MYKLFGGSLVNRREWVTVVIALLVLITGLVTISSTLEALVHIRHSRIVDADAHTTLLAGLSLIYLASLLRRGKYTAWLVSLPIFMFLAFRNIRHFTYDLSTDRDYDLVYFLNLFLPILVLAVLVLGRHVFRVRSEILSFPTALRRSIIVLFAAFLYGTVGFQLMDKHDFHQDIALQSGMHYTLDQFGLTTDQRVVAYTRRAHLFLGSLGVISLGSLFYVAVSFFSPIRFRLSSHQREYEEITELLKRYPANSEDFFILWPRDKAYYFSALRQSAIAYRVSRGVALAVADPIGNPKLFHEAVDSFGEFCRLNDWLPAFIHTLPDNLDLYTK